MTFRTADLALSEFSSKSSMRQQSNATEVSSEIPRWLDANGRRGMMECNDSTPAQMSKEIGKGSSCIVTLYSGLYTYSQHVEKQGLPFSLGSP